MSGDEPIRADLARGCEQLIKFHVAVAERARNWRAAFDVIGDEWLDHILLEPIFEIHDVMRKLEMLGDALRVVYVVDGAAAMAAMTFAGEFGQAALIPELHGEADDVFAAIAQNCGDGGTVDAAAHRYGRQGRVPSNPYCDFANP